jgi:hypothetical protein
MVAGWGATVAAQRPERTLPNFAVADANGEAVPSATFAAARRVLLVYARPDCRACDQLLTVLARSGEPELAARLIVIVPGSVDDTKTFVSKSLPQELQGAAVYTDTRGEAWDALHLQGVPVMMGIEGPRIDWTLSGALDRRLLESAVRSWLAPGAGGQ